VTKLNRVKDHIQAAAYIYATNIKKEDKEIA